MAPLDEGWALVVSEGWAFVIGEDWALVVGGGWALVVGKAGRDVGVTAVEQELIILQVLTSLYTASFSAPVPPSHWGLGKPSITASSRFAKYWTII